MNVWEESREESFDRDGAVVTRTFRVEPYIQRLLFIEVLLGGIELINGYLVRILPARDPWMPWLWCQDAKVTHIDALNTPGSEVGISQLVTRNYAESARVVATFKTLTPETQAGVEEGKQEQGTEDNEKELSSEAWEFSSTQVTRSNAYFMWKHPSERELLAQTQTGVTATLPKVSHVMVRHFCTNLPFNAITQLMGRVNGVPFKTRRFIWAKEMLCFDGLSQTEKVTNKGVPFMEATYKFEVMPVYDLAAVDGSETTSTLQWVGWNRQWRPEKAQWERPVAVADAGRGPYLIDQDVPSQTFKDREVKGFDLLFHPAAT